MRRRGTRAVFRELDLGIITTRSASYPVDILCLCSPVYAEGVRVCSYFPPCGAVSSTDRLVFCVTVALTGPEIERGRERERERGRERGWATITYKCLCVIAEPRSCMMSLVLSMTRCVPMSLVRCCHLSLVWSISWLLCVDVCFQAFPWPHVPAMEIIAMYVYDGLCCRLCFDCGREFFDTYIWFMLGHWKRSQSKNKTR